MGAGGECRWELTDGYSDKICREIFTPVFLLRPTTAAPAARRTARTQHLEGGDASFLSFISYAWAATALKAFWGHYATSPTHLLLLRLHIFQCDQSDEYRSLPFEDAERADARWKRFIASKSLLLLLFFCKWKRPEAILRLCSRHWTV